MNFKNQHYWVDQIHSWRHIWNGFYKIKNWGGTKNQKVVRCLISADMSPDIYVQGFYGGIIIAIYTMKRINRETQPPASIGWVALSSLVRSVVPHSDISSHLHSLMFQTLQTIYFLWGYDPGNMSVSFIAELSPVYCCLVDSVTWIKFSNNMAPLALVAFLATRWRHLH